MKPISNFHDGEHGFLSNFFIEPDGSSVEVEYQREKCALPEDRDRFTGLTPAQAKKLGRKVKIREDWDQVKLQVMYDLVLHKFTCDSRMAYLLMQTGDTDLIEGNWWGDRFWGVFNGHGDNHLGKILMKVRKFLFDNLRELSWQLTT